MDRDVGKRKRIPILLAVTVVHGLVLYGALSTFGVVTPLHMELTRELIRTFVPKPIPLPRPEARRAKRAAGGAAKPAGKNAEAAPVLTAPRIVAAHTTMAAAPNPAAGMANLSGAAETGAGGGGGGVGNGAGGGTDLRLISGEIRDSDYPRDALRLHQDGKVYIRFTVGINGRVTDCAVTRSSGSPSLDDATCRLIITRFRYEPSRDALGQPFADVVDGVQEWQVVGSPANTNADENGN